MHSLDHQLKQFPVKKEGLIKRSLPRGISGAGIASVREAKDERTKGKVPYPSHNVLVSEPRMICFHHPSLLAIERVRRKQTRTYFPQGEQGTGQMKEARIGCDEPLLPHQQASKMAEPGKCPLTDPAIPPELASTLTHRFAVVGSGGDDRLNSPLHQGPLSRLLSSPSHRPSGGLDAGGVAQASTVSRVFSTSVTSAGNAKSRYAPNRVKPFTSCPCPFWSWPLWIPFFAQAKLPSAKYSSHLRASLGH